MNEEFKDEVKISLTKKMSIGFFAICIIGGMILATLSWLYTMYHTRALLMERTVDCALDVANMLEGAPLDDILQGKEQLRYKIGLKALKNITNTFQLKYIYVYIPDINHNKLISIYGVENGTDKPIEGFELGESPNLKLDQRVMENYKKGEKTFKLHTNNYYGWVLSGYATVFDDSGKPMAIVGADVDFERYIKRSLLDTFLVSIIIIFTISIIYWLAIRYINKTFVKPLLHLSSKMRNFVRNDNFRYTPIKMNTNDEFNLIADSYNTMAENIKSSIQKILNSQVETIFSLAKLIQTRDDSTGKHIERVQAYCKILAVAVMVEKLHPDIVNKTFIRNLVNACPLHDIGKVAINDVVLQSTSKLTPEEIEKMQKHTIYGEETLKKIYKKYSNNDFIKIGMLIARSHHEKWDGSGYPDGLKGEEIPLAARIAAIADVYDALATKRVYKKAFPHSKCVQIILEGKGTHFDPQLIAVFERIQHKFLQIRQNFEEQEIRSFFDEADEIL